MEFRNPFDVATEFNLAVDDASFSVGANSVKIDPKKAQNISVNFKDDKAKGARLIISCEQAEHPWIFYLNGTMA